MKLPLEISLILFLSGCVTMSPNVYEVRDFQAIFDSSEYLEIPNGMVFYDARPATKGIRFPEGNYPLVGEDEEYFYFQSPLPISVREFARGKVIRSDSYNGGIMYSKRFSMVPGAGYIEVDGSKVMIWKLGGEFLSLELKEWTRK